jgi:acyl-CoA thioester hydrolase
MSNRFSEKFRVYYEDTDAGGIVYHANYLAFFERARTDFLRDLNIHQSDLVKNEKVIFVVRRCEIDYLSPARLDDLIEVSAEVTKISATSLVMHQEMKKDDKLLAAMDVVVVCIDSENFRPKKIPQEVVVKIK